MKKEQMEEFRRAKIQLSPRMEQEIKEDVEMLPFVMNSLGRLVHDDYGDGYLRRAAYPLTKFGRFAPDLCLIVELHEMDGEPCLSIYMDEAWANPPEEIQFN